MPPQKAGSQGIKRRLGHETKTVDLLDNSSFTYSYILLLFFWYLYSTTCKKYVHVVEKMRPQLCFNQCPQYSLALRVLIRIFFCEYGPLFEDILGVACTLLPSLHLWCLPMGASLILESRTRERQRMVYQKRMCTFH